jgi:hypothetical protein
VDGVQFGRDFGAYWASGAAADHAAAAALLGREPTDADLEPFSLAMAGRTAACRLAPWTRSSGAFAPWPPPTTPGSTGRTWCSRRCWGCPPRRSVKSQATCRWRRWASAWPPTSATPASTTSRAPRP